MIAPAIERAPRMLLVIGEDEQGLPTETIILEPSVSDAARVAASRTAEVAWPRAGPDKGEPRSCAGGLQARID